MEVVEAVTVAVGVECRRADLASEHAGCLRTAPRAEKRETTALLRTGEPVVGSAWADLPRNWRVLSSRALTVASRANRKEIVCRSREALETVSSACSIPQVLACSLAGSVAAPLQFGSNPVRPNRFSAGQRLTTPRGRFVQEMAGAVFARPASEPGERTD